MTSKFIGRTKELELLESEYRREHSFVLITGRRRIGKTRLITEFVKRKDALYFLATQLNTRSMLDDFSTAISTYSGHRYGMFQNWEEAFSLFADYKKGKKILVLDEFKYLLDTDSSVLIRFQKIWDEILSKHNIMLIICGSHISVMEELEKNVDNPLYGRFTRHLTLNPLTFEETRGNMDFISAVEEYSVHGGVPRYMEIFEGRSLRKNILNNILDPSGIMFNDPYILFRGEVKEPAGYMSIMKAVAFGNRKISSISSALEVPATTLTPYLKRLTEIHMMTRTVPITENDPKNSKLGQYSIADNYTAFWFRFVQPFASMIINGNIQWVLGEFDGHFQERHVSFVFEEICRQQVWTMSENIGFRPMKVGRFWNSKIEIDVVAMNTQERRVFLGECKFRSRTKVDRHVLDALKQKCRNVKAFDGCSVVYGLFSVSGFDETLMNDADVVLIDKGEVLKRPR